MEDSRTTPAVCIRRIGTNIVVCDLLTCRLSVMEDSTIPY